MKKILKIKDYKIVVKGRQGQDGFVPLSFDVFFNGLNVNSSLSHKSITKIEELIHEYFSNPVKH